MTFVSRENKLKRKGKIPEMVNSLFCQERNNKKKG